MAVNWTKEQQQVIMSRDRNLLVSAAAGSGKTAVLVERIIQMVIDPEQPIDIDQLLVMTFTNAAAAEMKERISAAIEAQLEKRPYDEHLQRQATLVQYAQITTIDSFCLYLIRNYFDQLEIDPSFRIGDEGELKLLQSDTMEKMLEDFYSEGEPLFEQFVDIYAVGKADQGIDDYIYQAYQFSQSNPWPDDWIDQGLAELDQEEGIHWMDTAWMRFLMKDAALSLGQLVMQLDAALEICADEGGPYMYLPTLQNDQDALKAALQAETYQQLNERLRGFTFGRLAAARDKQLDPDKKAAVSSIRDRVKKAVLKLKSSYCQESFETIEKDMEQSFEMIKVLLLLTREYAKRYQAAKRDKNIVDFNDLEHFALSLLVSNQDGEYQYTALADHLSKQFREILVDEYQDSNLVQEALILSLSGERFGHPNVFMVGDVKQSIYKFRLARPELFMEKYARYTEAESSSQKIELHQNFRSREQVLTSINDIFYRIMTRDLGNIEYTEKAALHCGASFAKGPERTAEATELLLIPVDQQSLDEDEQEYTIRELEIKVIAEQIKQLIDPDEGLMVWDKEADQYRICRPGDIVILLRSMSGWSEVFLQGLSSAGIMAYADSSSGYFNTIEIEIILSFLAVIDNPMQDIALTAVLRSPIVNLSDQELSYLAAVFKNQTEEQLLTGMYGAVSYCINHETRYLNLKSKLTEFWQQLEELKFQSTYLTTHQMLYEIYDKTGYYDYACAMPGGEGRKANLDMLIEKAAAYEKTSYKGLFHFIRYIEKLKKYDTDFGEALAAADQDQAVRIMSIHKSKGLEFPVVFLSGMGKLFNKQDTRSKIVIDPELGIATDFFDLDLRVKATTLKKEVIKRKMELDSLGEELRVLYVALTRAKEKLYMTAADKSIDKKIEKWSTVPLVRGQIPSGILASAGSYLDWVLMSNADPLDSIVVSYVSPTDLFRQEKERYADKEITKDELLEIPQDIVFDQPYQEYLQAQLSYQYPHQADVRLFTKISVSEIKKQSQQPEEEAAVLFPDQAPKGKAGDGKSAAFRGTAYHRILECLDFGAVAGYEDLVNQIKQLGSEGKISAEADQAVDAEKLWQLLQSDLGRRLKRAQQNGLLYREQQFVVGFPAAAMKLSDTDEMVLVQGMIDAYLEEEGKLVLIDYKSDWVLEGQQDILKQRYKEQLYYYKKALEQITGKQVKESILYSFSLNRPIMMEDEEV